MSKTIILKNHQTPTKMDGRWTVLVKFSVSPIPEIPALDDQDGTVAKIDPRMNKTDGGWFRLYFTPN